MIFIDRTLVPRPDILDLENPDSPASKERRKAILHDQDPDNHPKVDFTVYRRDEVKLALIELCRGKCAYCETPVNPTSSQNIEHFRPKGQINPGSGEEIIRPGYFWLAASWDNLLLSCNGCNERRRQLLPDENGNYIFAEVSTGKLDFFPLRAGGMRVTDPEDDIMNEEDHRLLLNPCLDNPYQHLSFDDEGNVFPRTIQGEVSDRAKVSIFVYQLSRHVLVEARKERFLDMVNAWHNLELASQMIDDLSAANRDYIRASIRLNENVLLSYTEDRKSYAGMARWLFNRKFRRMVQEIKQRFEDTFGEAVD